MPADPASELKFEIGHVLFIDIVGYSKLLINEQSERIQELREIVRGTEQFRSAEAQGKLMRLPTGDGGALVFRTSPEAPVLCALEISKALKTHPELRVRMGIHSGPVSEITDLNEQANIAGAGINVAQRVMDCGDAGHILLSKHIAEDLEQYRQWQPYLHELGECEVKHGVRVPVVNLYTDEVGNSEEPEKVRKTKVTQPASATRVSDAKPARRSLTRIAALIIALAAAAAGLYIFSHRPAPKAPPSASARAPVAIPEKSIAVLPFENLSRDPDNAYFADGIQEEILMRLSKIADLKVISRTSTQRYKSAPTNLAEIGKQLGVAHILEGTVQKEAEQVRVNVQLINATNDSHLWADKFDRKLTNIFAVESEIATKIADTLQTTLSGAEQRALAERPTQDTEAHELYLRGRYFAGKRGEQSTVTEAGENIRKAIDYFNQAIAKDPNYALAYAGLSDSYSLLPQWATANRAEYVSKAKAAAIKALELDDNLAEAHTSFATALFDSDLNLPASKREFERAIELNPNYVAAHYFFGLNTLSALGEFDRAIAELRHAVDLDPFSLLINSNLGFVLTVARRYPEAIVQLQKTLELGPNYGLAHRQLGEALELSGHMDKAIVEYEKAYKFTNDTHALAYVVHAYGLKGEREKALQLFTQLKEVEPEGRRWAFGVALVYLGLGDKDEAINWLERSYRDKEAAKISLLKVDPMLDSLRDDPRFEALVQKVVGAEQK